MNQINAYLKFEVFCVQGMERYYRIEALKYFGENRLIDKILCDPFAKIEAEENWHWGFSGKNFYISYDDESTKCPTKELLLFKSSARCFHKGFVTQLTDCNDCILFSRAETQSFELFIFNDRNEDTSNLLRSFKKGHLDRQITKIRQNSYSTPKQ